MHLVPVSAKALISKALIAGHAATAYCCRLLQSPQEVLSQRSSGVGAASFSRCRTAQHASTYGAGKALRQQQQQQQEEAQHTMVSSKKQPMQTLLQEHEAQHEAVSCRTTLQQGCMQALQGSQQLPDIMCLSAAQQTLFNHPPR